MSKKTLAFILVNIFLVVAFIWVLKGDRVHVHLDFKGTKINVNVSGWKVMEVPRHGVKVSGIRFERGAKPLPGALKESSWDNLTVRKRKSGRVILYEDFNNDPGPGWNIKGGAFVNKWGQLAVPKNASVSISDTDEWGDFTLDVDYVNGTEGLMFLTSASGKQIRMVLRCFPDSDVNISVIDRKGSRKKGATKGIYRKWYESLRSILGKLLMPYWSLLALLLGLWLFLGASGWIALNCRSAWLKLRNRPPPRYVPQAQLESAPASVRRKGFIRRNLAHIAAGVIIVFSVILLAYVNTAYLERIPHVQDSVCTLWQAKMLAQGKIYNDIPEFPKAFRFQFMVMKFGKWFSKYPFGYPLLLMWGVIAGVPWLVPPLLGGLAMLLMYLICLEIFDRKTGLWACFLMLASPFFVYLGASYMSHTCRMFYLMLFIYCFIMGERRNLKWPMFIGGLSLGLLFNTQPLVATFAALPLGVYGAVRLFRRKDRKSLFNRYRWMIRGFLLFFLCFFLYNFALTGDPLVIPYEQSPKHIGKIPSGKEVEYILRIVDRGLHIYDVYITALQMTVFNWPIHLNFMFMFVPFVFLRGKKWDWLLLAVFGSVILGYYAYWHTVLIFGPRYFYELLPFFMILTARGIVISGELVHEYGKRYFEGARWWRGSKLIPKTALFIFVCILVEMSVNRFYFSGKPGPVVFNFMPTCIQKVYGFNYTQPRIQKSIAEAGISENSLVFVKEERNWWAYGSVFFENDPNLEKGIIFVRDLGPDKNAKIMDHYPDRDYYKVSYAGKSEVEPIDYSAQWNRDLQEASEKEQPIGFVKIARGTEDRFYLTDQGNNQVVVVDNHGSFASAFGKKGSGPGDLSNPCGLSVDKQGNIYVCDRKNHRIQQFKPDGTSIRRIDLKKTGLGIPYDIAIAPNGNLVFSDIANRKVVILDNEGNLIKAIDSRGENQTAFAQPTGVTTDKQGNIYVVDSGNMSVSKFSPEGDYILEWMPCQWSRKNYAKRFPYYSRQNDTIYIVSEETGEVDEYSVSGELKLRFRIDPEAGEYAEWTSVAADDEGNLFAVDARSATLKRFRPPLIYNAFKTGCGQSPGRFSDPRGIIVDAAGDFYVADKANGRIQKFDSGGEFLMQWGAAPPDDAMILPYDVAIDRDGNICVIDHKDTHIRKYTPDGRFLANLTKGGSLSTFAPRGVECDSNGDFIILDSGFRKIHVLGPDMTALATFGGRGSEEGAFDKDPLAIYADAETREIYVADRGNARIQVFDYKGNHLREWPCSASAIVKITKRNGTQKLAVADLEDGSIYMYDFDGSNQTKLRFSSGRGREKALILGLDFDPERKILYAVDNKNCVVYPIRVP